MTRPIVGLSDETTTQVIGRVRGVLAAGPTNLNALAARLELDTGLVAAALRRMQEDDELTLEPATRTFTLKET